MVAPFDLSRYRPPLAVIQDHADGLLRLLDGGVDPTFVREESIGVLRELADFAAPRFSFGRLESKVKAAATVDVDTLERALAIIEAAPLDPEPVLAAFAERRANLRSGIAAIREHQLEWPELESLLRIGVAFEPWLTEAIIPISADWDPEPLVALVRPKLAALSEQDRADLWSRVLSEHRPAEDPDLSDYRLVDHGVLPAGFLEPRPEDRDERLARYLAWLRPRVIREMQRHGRDRYGVPDVGLARILSLRIVDDPLSATEISIARSLGNVAGWIGMQNEPLTVEEFARLLTLDKSSPLLVGRTSQDFAKRKWKGDAAERAAIHSILGIATGIDAIHGHAGPLEVALFQYKAGIELMASTPDQLPRWEEVRLQKHLCKFLLERGILAVGTKFGQHETDLVARVSDEYIVVECKLLKKAMPGVVRLEQNLAQLLRYDSLNPAFRGRRGILVLYNFTDVPLLAPREPVGLAWILPVNAACGPPSATRRCVQIAADPAHVLRCIDVGYRRPARRPRSRRKKP